MRCPFCGELESQVKDSRPSDDGTAIRRRRHCPQCGGRFTTFERVQLRELTILKRSGRRAPFDREKLMPTALSNGVAVPHTRDFLLQESFDVVAVAFPKNPIEFGALDGQPVHTLFFLCACDDKRHLHLLAKLAHLSSKEQNLDYLLTYPSKAELLDYVKNWEGNLKSSVSREPAHV